MYRLRFRQVHLDFHTSPDIPGIGEEFSKEEYQKTLRKAHVNSITTFAVCHHGWSYNTTQVGVMHPELKFDLLRAQFDACKELDINVPIYISAGLNYRASMDHPEWNEVDFEGKSCRPMRAGFIKLCFNTPYLDHLCALIEEAAKDYPNCDGIFLDIIKQGQCCCPKCKADMQRLGMDVRNESDRKKFAALVLEKYYQRTTKAARKFDSNMPVFHNSGHITVGNHDILKYFSHLELESLPTGGWGYDHYPLSAAYSRNLPLDFLGMTGKFHTTWGEFGGFKHPNALRYECAAIIANGSKCSIGDQLHPSGKLDASTYELIGTAYSEVEAKEPWCDNVVSAANVAILSSADSAEHKRELPADIGASRILLEAQIPFELIDRDMDFERFKFLVLPDEVYGDVALKAKLEKFMAHGGKLIFSGTSCVDKSTGKFVMNNLPFVDEGASPWSPDFVMLSPEIAPHYLTTAFVMYLPSRRIKVSEGLVLGEVYDPYFNRNCNHFCSHQHTPNKPYPSGYASGVMTGNILYFAHPVFSIYRGFGAVGVKESVLNAMRKFMGNDILVCSSLPSTARVTCMEQPGEQRYVLHLLYANTINRGGKGIHRVDETNYYPEGTNIEVIEELNELSNINVSVKTAKLVCSVKLVPGGQDLKFEIVNGRSNFTVPSLICHQMVELSY